MKTNWSSSQTFTEICMASMNATVIAMHKEGILTAEQANRFLDEHICTIASPQNAFKTWIKRIYSKDAEIAVCAKIIKDVA